MITVGAPYFPDRKKLAKYIDRIYENGWLTNNGPLVRELTDRLEEYLGVSNLLLVANGTLALQVAYRTLGIQGEAVTTPFSFVATTSSLQWEGIKPVFADIDPATFCLDPKKVETEIRADTTALVPVHVFGNACDVEGLGRLASRHGLKIVYDGAHAFGVRYQNGSLLQWGDATTLSFHATKLFHSAEGGAIVFKEKDAHERAKLLINFGINAPDSIVSLGINAKLSELQAAMGLCVLDDIHLIFEQRAEIWHAYEKELSGKFELQTRTPGASNNFAYFPILFPDETTLLVVKQALLDHGINCRRYFYPSLDTLPSLAPQTPQLYSQHVATRILCLPIDPGLHREEVRRISNCILGVRA
jgi:dTDP-4-amino-4,6-dideoxygalactose transaminase